MSKKPKGSSSPVTVLLTVLIFVMIALTGLVIFMCINLVNKTPQPTVRTVGWGVLFTRLMHIKITRPVSAIMTKINTVSSTVTGELLPFGFLDMDVSPPC